MAVNQDFKKSTVSTTNHTQNYDLPLWAGEDTTSWLTQMNDAMNKIDDGMVDAKSKALEVVGIAADAKKLADETKAESAASAKIVAGYNDRLTATEEKIVEHTQDITNLNTRSDQFDVELHSVQEVQKKTTADLATLAEKVDSNKTEVDGKITSLTEKQTELENAQTSQGNSITTLTTEVDTIKTDVGNLKTRVDGDDTAIAGLTTRMSAVEKAAQTTQTNLTTLSENTQNSFTELDSRLSGDEEQITAIDGRVTKLEEGGSSSGDIAKKEYVKSSTFDIYSDAQSKLHTIDATATLTIEKKNGTYIFGLSTAIAPSIDLTTSSNRTYGYITVQIPQNVTSDFPELATLTTIELGNLVGSGQIGISGYYLPAVISSIFISSSAIRILIRFAPKEFSGTGKRSFNPEVKGFGIV